MENNVTLVESFSDFKEMKNIDRVTLMSILEDVFRSMIRKKYGSCCGIHLPGYS